MTLEACRLKYGLQEGFLQSFTESPLLEVLTHVGSCTDPADLAVMGLQINRSGACHLRVTCSMSPGLGYGHEWAVCLPPRKQVVGWGVYHPNPGQGTGLT